MSTTSPTPLRHSGEDDDRAAAVGVVKILMARAGIRSRAALAMATKPRISQSTLYSRMNLETDWTKQDLRCLADVFDVPPAVFFVEPTLAAIAPYLGTSPADLGEELAASQNRKKMMGPDLHVIAGEATARTAPAGNLRRIR